mgnify:CR=1 FL=1
MGIGKFDYRWAPVVPTIIDVRLEGASVQRVLGEH